MCILAVATAGAVFSRSTLEDMFYANSDGAGWAYARNGLIYYSKGYTSVGKFIKAVQKLPLDCERMVHCRIGTHGGITKELTHPFPVSRDYRVMERLNGTLSRGYILAHNGILNNFTPDKLHSDTEELVRCLANIKGDIMDEGMRDLINALIKGSRVAILNTDGKIKRYGTGWTEIDGIWYSNTHFRRTYKYSRAYNWDDWDDWSDYGNTATAPALPSIDALVPLKAGEVYRLPYSKRAYINATDGSYLVDDKTGTLYGLYKGSLFKSAYTRCDDYACAICEYTCPFKDGGGD